MASYALNQDAVTHAKQLIDSRQYVLRSRWQDVQPRAREQNAFLKTHSWEEYAAWHLGLTEGAGRNDGNDGLARSVHHFHIRGIYFLHAQVAADLQG